MNPSESSPKYIIKPEDWAEWNQQLQSETDRGLATAAAAILDHLLARLIGSFLVEDQKITQKLLGNPFSPLGSFAARTMAAYSLGLISADEMDDLNSIRDIRNDFAHQLTSPSFNDQSIAQKVRNLKTPMLIPSTISNKFDIPPKELFRSSVSMLSTFIDKRTRSNREKRMSPKGFKIVAT